MSVSIAYRVSAVGETGSRWLIVLLTEMDAQYDQQYTLLSTSFDRERPPLSRLELSQRHVVVIFRVVHRVEQKVPLFWRYPNFLKTRGKID